jgi:hypothetical protein
MSKRKLPFFSNDNYNTIMQIFYKKVPYACRTMDSLFNFCCNLGVRAVGLLVKLVVEISWLESLSLLPASEFQQSVAILTKKGSLYMPSNGT